MPKESWRDDSSWAKNVLQNAIVLFCPHHWSLRRTLLPSLSSSAPTTEVSVEPSCPTTSFHVSGMFVSARLTMSQTCPESFCRLSPPPPSHAAHLHPINFRTSVAQSMLAT